MHPLAARILSIAIAGVSLLTAASGCQEIAATQAVSSASQTVQTSEQAASAAVSAAQSTAQTAVQGATAAISAVPGGQLALDLVPGNILNFLNTVLSNNKSMADWGKPQSVFVANGYYVFVFPPATGLFKKPQPRFIAFDSMGQIARLERLKKYGY